MFIEDVLKEIEIFNVSLFDEQNAINLTRELGKKIYTNFNKSIIAGEYYVYSISSLSENKIKAVELIENFKGKVQKNKKLEVKIKIFLNTNLDLLKDVTERLFDRYERLAKYCEVGSPTKKYAINSDSFGSTLEKTRKFNTGKDNLDKYFTENFLFEFNIFLSKIENDYNCNDEYLRVLNQIEKELTSSPINVDNEVLINLKYKCLFLIYKIELRKYKNSVLEDTNDVSEYPSISNKRNIIFELEDELCKEKNPYNYFFKQLKEIYSSNYRLSQKKEIELLKSIDDSKNVIFSMHYLSKAYRKKGDVDKLVDLQSRLKTNFDKLNSNKFDSKAYQYVDVFLQTQKFRAKMRNIILDFNNYTNEDDFKKLKNNISDIDKEYTVLYQTGKSEGVKDYKIITYYNDFLIEILKKANKLILKHSNKKESFELIKQIRKSYKLNYLKFNERVKWAKEDDFMPIYLDFKNCKLNNNVFLDTSYLLPIDFKFDYNFFNTNRDRLNEELSNIQFDFNHLEMESSEIMIETVIRKNQYTSIQIIAVFAALITFVSTSTGLMATGTTTLKDASYVLIALTLSFSLFSLLLNAILRNKNQSKWTVFIVYLIIFISIFLIHHLQ